MPEVSELPERFQQKILVMESGCWEWMASRFPAGYGQVSYQGRPQAAHRAVAELLGFPLGEHMHHECLNRPCVNPLHLTPISATDHSIHHHTKSHCKWGHSLDDAYIVKRRDGSTQRFCSICMKERQRRRWANLPAHKRAAEIRARSDRRRQAKANP